MKTRRAAVDPLTLTILAVVGVAVLLAPSSSKPGRKHFWEFWKKDPIAQVNAAAAAVDAAKAKAEAERAAAAALVTAEKDKQLHVAQEAAIATGSAIAAAQVKTNAGALPVRELDTARQLNATNTQAMDQAIGAASPARIRELEQMVADLNAGIVAGVKSLELLQGTLEATVKEKAAATAKLEQIEAVNKIAIAKLEEVETRATKQEQAWAIERDGVARYYERISFWSKLVGALGFLLVGYVAFLWLRVRGLANFGKDAVGMTEMLKQEIKARVSAQDYAAVKEKIRSDWMTVADGSAQLVDRFKAELRL